MKTRYAKITYQELFGLPADMLRYDACHTVDNGTRTEPIVANGIATSVPQTFSVMVESDSKKSQNWTTARWQSFGCHCEPIKEIDVKWK